MMGIIDGINRGSTVKTVYEAVRDEYKHRAERAEAENAALREALEQIKVESGVVCPDYEICDHAVCRSSHAAWTIADEALAVTILIPSNSRELRGGTE